MAEARQPRLFIVPTPRVTEILASPPEWGVDWKCDGHCNCSTLDCSAFQGTYFRPLQQVLLHRLAAHPSRTTDIERADACVVVGGAMRHPRAPKGCVDYNVTCPGKLLLYLEVRPAPVPPPP